MIDRLANVGMAIIICSVGYCMVMFLMKQIFEPNLNPRIKTWKDKYCPGWRMTKPAPRLFPWQEIDRKKLAIVWQVGTGKGLDYSRMERTVAADGGCMTLANLYGAVPNQKEEQVTCGY